MKQYMDLEGARMGGTGAHLHPQPRVLPHTKAPLPLVGRRCNPDRPGRDFFKQPSDKQIHIRLIYLSYFCYVCLSQAA